ncbi:adenylate cyclase type 10 [Osmia lignaria lignaria]|uniref:adenylate cyclase type 10 n=1 Tax=Osmia lignaria lignaria TaxID=1437193 RepID=UPI00402B9B86
MDSEEEQKVAWTPDIIGPIFKHRQNVTLREALNAHRDDMCTRMMATFVADELIYETDLSKKSFRKFKSVIALIDVTRLFNGYEKFASAHNGGSYALFELLNRYMGVMIEEVYTSMGDVVKFSQDGLLVVWKVSRNEFISRMVYNVILCGQKIQDAVGIVKNSIFAPKVDVVVATGEVIFSVIGCDSARQYIIAGSPIEELKLARRICLPGDLVLSTSAWEYCAPTQYEYVIKDSSNVKIIKVLGPPVEPPKHSTTLNVELPSLHRRRSTVTTEVTETISEPSMYTEMNEMPFRARVSVIDAYRRRLGNVLKTYMLKPVLKEIDNEEPLEYLTEVRNVTVVSVNIVPGKCSIYELISLVDEAFKTIQSIIEHYSGCINMINLFDKDVLFSLSYGVSEYRNEEDDESNAKNAIFSAWQIMNDIKSLGGVKGVSIGLSSGMAFCGVIGHTVRRQYMIFGTPVDKAISLMLISHDKVSCDYEAYSDSLLSKHKFRSRGIKTLRRFGKCFVYDFINSPSEEETMSNLEYCYPILDRFQELEYFKDILDEIGVVGRSYSGMLIEGPERSGKSRLLDAFITIVRNRQIKVIQLALHPSYNEKAYAVLYHVFIQLFDATNCHTIYDREKAVSAHLADILEPDDFCYLNCIMRVCFPLSKGYCEDTDWKRHTKTIEIFEHILHKISGRVCILLDDVQFMDLLSWQFFAVALSNVNVVLVVTLVEPISWDNLTQIEAGICQDKRLMSRTLTGLDSKYIAAFACQFLNVQAIPKSLEKVLKKRGKTAISWCEAFLMSTIQVRALNFISISPTAVSQYDLVFPDNSLLVKIPAYLTPEELAPPLHWSQMSSLNICVTSDRPTGFIASNRDVTGLRIDIYNRMNSYEQDFIKCASAMGTVFMRHVVENAMVNSSPLYTKKGRLRILQCAMIQRKYFHADDSVYYLFKKRKTFSNMHHLVTCDCQSSRIFMDKTLPHYAYCKILEFTRRSYRKLLYDILAPHEKEDYHSKAVTFFEREAQRCSTCGGGSFVNLFSAEVSKVPVLLLFFLAAFERFPSSQSTNGFSRNSELLHRKVTSWNRPDRVGMESRRSIFVAENNGGDKKKDVNIRRISVLPVHIELDDDDSGVSSEPGKEGYTTDYTRKQKRGAVSSSGTAVDDLWDSRLKEFSYINYRNCRCNEVTSYVFWKLRHHIERSKDFEKLMKLMIEYTAALIQTAQPLFATKFLAVAITHLEVLKIKEHVALEAPDSDSDKGKTLILMGDAYVAYGNYSQASKFYIEAVSMRTELLHTAKAVCYRSIVESLKHRMRGFPNYNVNKITGVQAVYNFQVAVYLHRLATIYMLQNQAKIAKLTILQSIRAAFECVGGFVEKGRIYLTALEIFQKFEGNEFIEPLEKLMVTLIDEQSHWKSPEAIVVAATVFQTMFNSRILQGKLSEGIEIGIKILKICNALHITKIKLDVLPLLIELTIWTKHLNEAADLLQELYASSKEDTDYSAITWYHALCLECILDAGMIVKSYRSCFNFYLSTYASKFKSCVLRDPQSFSRLVTCLAIWQLRMNMVVNEALVEDVDEYTEGINYDNFSQIYNCVKGLECYMLILKRRINIKRSSDLFDRVHNIKTLIKIVQESSNHAKFVKPFLHLLQAYMELLRGRKGPCHNYLHTAHKCATSQGNKMILAWIEQNKRTWKEANFNNMAQYWVEHVGAEDAIRWQEIHKFGMNAWSTIMFPLPVPDSTV